LISRKSGATEAVSSATPPLGLIKHAQFSETTVDLALGDVFLLYTDGLLGAIKAGSARLTPAQLGQMLDSSAPNAEALLARLLNRAAPDYDEKAFPDDVAALAVRRTS